MATKKREIYARAAVQLRTHDRCRRAEKACPGAMGLYLYLLVQSRGEATNGTVSEAAALESWGAPAYRRKQLEALIASGLVERIGEELHVVKYEEHNDTPEDIEHAREAARSRKKVQRGHAHVTRDIDVTDPVCHAEVPISYSLSKSGSGSSGGAGGPPDWWAGSIAATEQAVGGTVDNAEARWLEYDAARERKGWARNHRDAVGWLSTVVRTERRNARTPPPKSGSELTKQPFDPEAPWMKIGDTGS